MNFLTSMIENHSVVRLKPRKGLRKNWSKEQKLFTGDERKFKKDTLEKIKFEYNQNNFQNFKE